jgi:predicted house-cleaning noncanonical NTP pyrophosphatase (MazG superfamily)
MALPNSGKLVRDRIPQIIAEAGVQKRYSKIAHEDMKYALRTKLEEEVSELISSSPDSEVEELADVFEVLVSLSAVLGHPWGEVVRAAEEKRDSRGGFSLGVWLHD